MLLGVFFREKGLFFLYCSHLLDKILTFRKENKLSFRSLTRIFRTFAHLLKRTMDTQQQFKQAMAGCRDIFKKKLHDYGAAWRIMRPSSVTDQIFIKANRIRSLEVKGVSLVGEGIYPEFQAIVNYGIVGLIQLELGYAETEDMDATKAMEYYDKYAQDALELMLRKNHDYDEAWRSMRVSSYTDLILMKLNRTKQIEGHDGQTLISEGIDANYLDMINYSVFGLIKLAEAQDGLEG